MKKIRVLEVASMNVRAGIETYLINMFRYIDKNQIDINFLRTNRNDGPFDEEIRENGGRIYYVSPVSKNPIKLVKHFSEFRYFLKNNKFDVIHFHGNTAISLIDAKIARSEGVKHVVGHSHNNFVKNKRQRIIHKILSAYIRRYLTDRIACSNEAWVWMFGNNNSGTRYISKNGIETSKFLFNKNTRSMCRNALEIHDELVIGTVGRLTEQKNCIFLVKAFGKYCLNNPNSVLLFVGDGEYRAEIINEAKKLGIQNKVIITGFVSNPEDYLCAMDIFALPSLWEGLGICLIEAQASGLPCIVSNAIVSEAKIIDDLIHVVDEECDIDKWANMMECTKLENEREKYNAAVRDAGFDICDSAKQLQKFYSECVV